MYPDNSKRFQMDTKDDIICMIQDGMRKEGITEFDPTMILLIIQLLQIVLEICKKTAPQYKNECSGIFSGWLAKRRLKYIISQEFTGKQYRKFGNELASSIINNINEITVDGLEKAIFLVQSN